MYLYCTSLEACWLGLLVLGSRISSTPYTLEMTSNMLLQWVLLLTCSRRHHAVPAWKQHADRCCPGNWTTLTLHELHADKHTHGYEPNATHFEGTSAPGEALQEDAVVKVTWPTLWIGVSSSTTYVLPPPRD